MAAGTTVAYLGAGIAALGLLYLALATAMVLAFPRGRPARTGSAPSVTLLKPLHGLAPGLADNLRSLMAQDYAGTIQMVCGVQSAADPAVAVVKRLRAEFPERVVELAVDASMHGANRKVSNLVNMSRRLRGDVVILSDDDMRVPPDYVGRVVDALDQPGIGAVTCLYHGVAAASLWSELARLGIDTHFLPNVAVGLGLGIAKPCFGSTIALRAETLRRVGGFGVLADELADDYELGARVRALGLRVAVPGFTIGHVSAEATFAELARQDLRWARTIRQIDPSGHAGSIVSHPLPFALIAVLLGPGEMSAMLLVATLLLRFALCLAVERRFGLRRHPYWMLPVRDLVSFGVFVASFAGRGVTWRGQVYGVTQAGALMPKSEP